MAYATAAQVKTYLDISGSGDDTLIGDLIDRAQQMIDNEFGGIVFEASTNTERTFDSSRDTEGGMLYLDYPLASINSITNGDADVLTSTEYTTEPRNRAPYYAIKLLPSSGLYWQADATTGDAEDAITISGKWAWSASADSDIEHMCIRLASYLYRQRDNAADFDRAVIAGNATILPGQMPRDIQQLVKQHPAWFWNASR